MTVKALNLECSHSDVQDNLITPPAHKVPKVKTNEMRHSQLPDLASRRFFFQSKI